MILLFQIHVNGLLLIYKYYHKGKGTGILIRMECASSFQKYLEAHVKERVSDISHMN